MWIALSLEQSTALTTPCFVYDANVLRARVSMLRALDAKLLCAVKANPHPGVLSLLATLLDGADVASMGELDAALAAGFRAETVSFAGPGKSEAELTRAAQLGAVISLESPRELEVVRSLSPRVRVRVNAKTVFNSYRVPMTGVPGVFGFDEETLDEVLPALRELKVEGVHLHPGAQCTSVEGVLTVARAGLQLLERIGGASLNLGGGFGAIAPGKELDVAALAPKLRALRPDGVTFFFEPGRWLMGPAGLYVTRVIGTKHSRGHDFVVVDGGVHHFFSASAVLTPPNAPRAPVLNLSRPDAPLVKRSIHGVLCTPLDSLAHETTLPEPRVGDVLAFQGAGAYGPSFSPTAFLSHARPAEVLLN